jgi:hypothetical protein
MREYGFSILLEKRLGQEYGDWGTGCARKR